MRWIATYEAVNNDGFRISDSDEASQVRDKFLPSKFNRDEVIGIEMLIDRFMRSMEHLLEGKKLEIVYYQSINSNTHSKITDPKTIQTETTSMVIETDGDTEFVGHPGFDIEKREDDWFIVETFNRSKSFTGKRTYETIEWYICDEIDGLINLLEQKLQMR